LAYVEAESSRGGDLWQSFVIAAQAASSEYLKQRPEWATEDNLRRLILMPAARYMSAAQQFFQHGRSTIEIGRELGISKHAVRTFLGRIRKAVGAPRERTKDARLDRISKMAFESITQDGLVLNRHGVIRRSKGRHFADTWANNDRVLKEVVLGPALAWYDVARRYWLLGDSAPQIGADTGLKREHVEHVLYLVRRRAKNPHLQSRVLLARTRTGRVRFDHTHP